MYQDPCKDCGIWILLPDGTLFEPFDDVPKSVWGPARRHGLRKFQERVNQSHLAFPNGDDPCKGLGIWIPITPSGVPNLRFKFEPFEGVPEKEYKRISENATRILNARYKKELERRNVSVILFPDGNDPCKGYGVWIYLDSLRAFQFNDVPDAIWLQRLDRAASQFDVLPPDVRNERFEKMRRLRSREKIEEDLSQTKEGFVRFITSWMSWFQRK